MIESLNAPPSWKKVLLGVPKHYALDNHWEITHEFDGMKTLDIFRRLAGDYGKRDDYLVIYPMGAIASHLELPYRKRKLKPLGLHRADLWLSFRNAGDGPLNWVYLALQSGEDWWEIWIQNSPNELTSSRLTLSRIFRGPVDFRHERFRTGDDPQIGDLEESLVIEVSQ